MKSGAKVAITSASIAMGIIKFLYPSFVDWVTFAIFIAAIFPWIIELIERLEFFGTFAITIRDVTRAAGHLKKSKLYQQYQEQASTAQVSGESAWDVIDKDDPALAVVAVAIDIERELRKLAAHYYHHDKDQPVPITKLLRILQQHRILDAPMIKAILEFWDYRSAAVHGRRVTKDAAEMAVSVGRDILTYLRNISSKLK